jgi:hypothetical protein
MKNVACLVVLFASATAQAQYAPPPQQYSLTNVNTDETLHISRDGSKALIDTHVPKGPHQPVEVHTRTIVDIPSKTDLTWDLLDPKIPCDVPATGDWGDPFGYWDQTLQGEPAPKKVGKEMLNGMATTVYEVDSPEGTGKLWREDKYGLLVKFTLGQKKGSKPETLFEIKEFKVGKPDPAVFAVPARCKWKK